MNAPGKGLLKTVSVLFIIFGAIAAIVSLLGVAGSAALTSVGGVAGTAIGGVLLVATILILIVSVLELVLGIVGFNKCGDPHKASYFITVGVVMSIISLVPLILSAASGAFQLTSLIGFVLPILYIVGGAMNRNAITRGAAD
ncbi:hypothetical protein SAMN02745823_02245 [Sporobacter termitidis DSM 10068]|uniref:Uncharacterized protein n=1 Tax=Sporobacter termitidis DSM 10068 TaxID=1123282 RepID=A0A1M5Y5K4_9FIRM|nr:hypothetical protein [Sporobacter termitidis]SHI07282.1 hypothetical protein SAMN02745823_02245 [Sporobacter termitidis DSM 10068]